MTVRKKNSWLLAFWSGLQHLVMFFITFTFSHLAEVFVQNLLTSEVHAHRMMCWTPGHTCWRLYGVSVECTKIHGHGSRLCQMGMVSIPFSKFGTWSSTYQLCCPKPTVNCGKLTKQQVWETYNQRWVNITSVLYRIRQHLLHVCLIWKETSPCVSCSSVFHLYLY